MSVVTGRSPRSPAVLREHRSGYAWWLLLAWASGEASGVHKRLSDRGGVEGGFGARALDLAGEERPSKATQALMQVFAGGELVRKEPVRRAQSVKASLLIRNEPLPKAFTFNLENILMPWSRDVPIRDVKQRKKDALASLRLESIVSAFNSRKRQKVGVAPLHLGEFLALAPPTCERIARSKGVIAQAASCGLVIREELASGGFGTVYTASLDSGTGVSHDPDVAVKQPHTQDGFRFLQREFAFMQEFYSQSPEGLALAPYGTDETTGVMAMQLAKESLQDWVRRFLETSPQDRATNPSEVIIMAMDVLRALSIMHEHGYVHNDLKLDNLLLVCDGPKHDSCRVNIGDFGLSCAFDSEKTELKPLCHTEGLGGTYAYLPPELSFAYEKRPGAAVIHAPVADPSRDVWSAGVVIALILEPVLSNFIFKNVQKDPALVIDKLVEYRPDLTDGLGSSVVSCLGRMLVKDPEKRCSASACLQSLVQDADVRSSVPPASSLLRER